jgi:hypothetical protein
MPTCSSEAGAAGAAFVTAAAFAAGLFAAFFATGFLATAFLDATFLGAGFFAATGSAIGIAMPGMCPACWAVARLELASKAEAKAAFRIEDVTNQAPENEVVDNRRHVEAE